MGIVLLCIQKTHYGHCFCVIIFLYVHSSYIMSFETLTRRNLVNGGKDIPTTI